MKAIFSILILLVLPAVRFNAVGKPLDSVLNDGRESFQLPECELCDSTLISIVDNVILPYAKNCNYDFYNTIFIGLYSNDPDHDDYRYDVASFEITQNLWEIIDWYHSFSGCFVRDGIFFLVAGDETILDKYVRPIPGKATMEYSIPEVEKQSNYMSTSWTYLFFGDGASRLKYFLENTVDD